MVGRPRNSGKTRPCLVLSIPPGPQDRALIALVPHTTSVRETQFEVAIPKAFPKDGAFEAQGLIVMAPPRLIRKLGELLPSEMDLIEQTVKRWLGL